jgi:2-oxoglutarate ferredoxin oxidoreductase subunit gamma
MQTDLLLAGHGGQGILVTGQVIANAAMLDGKEVTYMPAYGGEVRGGTVHVTVVASDRRISSPFVPNPAAAVIMNRPSLDRFEPALAPGALLVYNTTLIDREPQRNDLRLVPIPANDIADAVNMPRAVTLVALGAYAAATGSVDLDLLMAALAKVLSPERHNLLPANRTAIEQGMFHYRKQVEAHR